VKRTFLALAGVVVVGLGCNNTPPLPAPTAGTKSADAAGDAAKPAPPEVSPFADLPESETQEVALGVRMPKKNADGLPILTPMDFALLVIDAESLTPDQLRKRSYARRKMIMNRPDSTAARALNDLTRLHKEGAIEAPAKDENGFTFYPRNSTPEGGGLPPAGWRDPKDAPAEDAAPKAGG